MTLDRGRGWQAEQHKVPAAEFLDGHMQGRTGLPKCGLCFFSSDNLEQEFLLPLAPGVGDGVRMKTSCTKVSPLGVSHVSGCRF